MSARVPFFGSWILLCLLNLPVGAASVDEEFEKYVNQAIPLSFSIATETARLKEYSLFVNRVSTAQAELAQAAQDIVAANNHLRGLPARPISGCPSNSDGGVDIPRLIALTTAWNQIVSLTDRARERVATYRKIAAGLADSCRASEHFDAYRASQLGLRFYIPGKPGLFDGVYFVYAQGSDGKSSGAESIPIIGSVYQMGRNFFSRNSIGEQAERLDRQIVKDADFRNLAIEACRNIVRENTEAFRTYEPLAVQIETFDKALPREALRAAASSLQACWATHETEVREHLLAEARTLADQRLEEQDRKARRLRPEQVRVRAKVRERLATRLLQLQDFVALPCGRAEVSLEKVEADLAQLRLYGIVDTAEQQQVAQIRATRAARCGVEW